MTMAHDLVTWRDRDDRPHEDHVVQLHDATWEDYERLLQIRGDRSAPRITYIEGTLEIMSPSRSHEIIKSILGCLVEVWCLEHQIRFTTVGSWTIKEKAKDRGAEPDECYLFGDPDDAAVRPDLAIEVIWTSGRLDKLQVYRKLGVREVWYWRQGVLTAYALRDDERYEEVAGSEVLPGIDLAQMASFLDRPSTYDAINDYRAALKR